ncbi:MAG: NUDIX domain-containing protein [Planctomycetes bacterium]|nr:NUDIX domain-containing protein [Planctomycetota bacterium]
MEFVYVVKRADLFDERCPHGFLPRSTHGDEIGRYLERARSRGFFLERRHAETDPSFQQIIPYVVILRGSEVLLLRRSKKGGDARLHDKLSIGLGGHINPPDARDGDLLAACARRELDEEVGFDEVVTARPVGIINDDSNPVGAVHFGVVHAARVAKGVARVRRGELTEASFVPLAELKTLAADPGVDMETWSRLIAEGIERVVEAV